jgi:hypothetical protein
MDNHSYKRALEDAQENLERLLRERDEIEAKISKLENAIDSLSILCERTPAQLPYPQEPEAYAVNLRDAMRLVFNMARPNTLTPTEVRDRLKENGFHLDRYKYELPPIHNTIARLEAAGEIELVLRADGEKAYRYVSVVARAIRRAKQERLKPLAHNFRPTGTTRRE